MTILRSGVDAVTAKGLLSADLHIPPYQRPYSWEPETALQLLDDIRKAMASQDEQGVPYVVGAVILHATGSGWDVVDGQQRLLTLRMALLLLDTAGASMRREYSNNPVGRVQSALRQYISEISAAQRIDLAHFINDSCQFVRIVTSDIDEAFRVFDSQNYRGKPLAPHDLLKAYHLREMRHETAAMKAAVVEMWESVSDADLNRLFSIYLYRIARWSRGESAPGFNIRDIGMFKGISARLSKSPSARYHIAAQAALPMLNAWSAPLSRQQDRNASRSRFQMDAPLVAGRPFFEMVAFMLPELMQVVREAFTGERAEFALYRIDAGLEEDVLAERPARNRYRFVSELYVAALLYYTNKFGGDELERARSRLFAWAYSARLELLRVHYRSIDKRARGDQSQTSPFVLMKNAESVFVARQILAPVEPAGRLHEGKLAELLLKLGA